MRVRWQRLALVDGAGDARGEPVAERRERARLGKIGLRVTDADLDGGVGEVRPYAPPELRVLRDRAGLVEKAHVALEPVPAVVGIWDAAAREHAREDLRARRVQACVDALEKGRAAGQREQLRQEVAQAVAHSNRAVGAVDRDVDVHPEAVVAPDDVAQELVVAAVMRRVDDALLLPGAPGMRPGGGERDADRLGELEELRPPLSQPGRGLVEVLAAARADLDLRGDQLANEVLLERRPGGGRLELLEPVRQRQRRRIEDRELLLDREREVARLLVPLAGGADLLLRAQALGV